MLSGAQRVAYVGLCRLVTREMVYALRRGKHKELEAAAVSMQNWATKIMGRLYYHMEIDTAGECDWYSSEKTRISHSGPQNSA